jgi:hypothetical protein
MVGGREHDQVIDSTCLSFLLLAFLTSKIRRQEALRNAFAAYKTTYFGKNS